MNNVENETLNEGVEDLQESPERKKLKLELECPVCHHIPTKLPIPCCPSGHILCQECLDKIREDEWFSTNPCPVCRTSIGSNTNSLAASLITFIPDISCPNNLLGCSFLGSADEINKHKAHHCLFEETKCFVCSEEMYRKDFYQHNHQNCFRKDVTNRFNPTKSCFFLVRDAGREVLVQFDMDFCNCKSIAITLYGMLTFEDEGVKEEAATARTKMKIIVEDPKEPSFKMEVTKFIKTGPYLRLEFCDFMVNKRDSCTFKFKIIN